MVVLAEPDKALLAVNVTVYLPACLKPGVQLSVPLLLSAAAVKVAPAGSPVALSELIASRSESAAVTSTVNSEVSVPEAVGGAVTTGGRSVFVTVMVVLEEEDSVLLAVNVTVYVP